ncbi:hypothetical protein TNCV_385761 [Trichonephila clavipes]|nr:hypothetical protein TNCV_385761 [Trichonephila clavipes]
MDICKCIVPLRHGGTLNSRLAASPLVWLAEVEERWEVLRVFPSKLGWKRTISYCPLHDQVMKTTPELTTPSPNHHTTPMGGLLGLDIFNEHRPPLHNGSSAVLEVR